MYTLHNFSIFTTEIDRKETLSCFTGRYHSAPGGLEILPATMLKLTQSHLYDPLFRLCHYRRAKAP